jgi:hypothetical protein
MALFSRLLERVNDKKCEATIAEAFVD